MLLNALNGLRLVIIALHLRLSQFMNNSDALVTNFVLTLFYRFLSRIILFTLNILVRGLFCYSEGFESLTFNNRI